ncbi:unknown [Sutterella sp. CAG:351]|nr:unknown [Sutterella sp. CAG:351]
MAGAKNNVTPFNPGADAVSNDILHLRVMCFDQMIETGFARRLHNAVRDGVREMLFKAGRDFEELILTPFTGRHHVREARGSLSKRSGLIEHHNVSLSE